VVEAFAAVVPGRPTSGRGPLLRPWSQGVRREGSQSALMRHGCACLVSLMSCTCPSLHTLPTGRTVAAAFAAMRGNGVPTEVQRRIEERCMHASLRKKDLWAGVMKGTASDEECAWVDGGEDMASRECLWAYLTPWAAPLLPTQVATTRGCQQGTMETSCIV
jgi:hypothetical protein